MSPCAGVVHPLTMPSMTWPPLSCQEPFCLGMQVFLITSRNATIRLVCSMQEGTYTIGGPCDPSADKACTPNAADGTTPLNQTARCSFTSILTSKKPGNDSYDRLMEHPYANDSAVVSKPLFLLDPCKAWMLIASVPGSVGSEHARACNSPGPSLCDCMQE